MIILIIYDRKVKLTLFLIDHNLGISTQFLENKEVEWKEAKIYHYNC